MVEPVLKWAGGKRQLLNELYLRFPETHESYHEPFVGGGAIFFDLEPPQGTINDTNERLANFYEVVKEDPNALIERCREFQSPESDPDPSLPHDDEDNFYYQQRERFNLRPREGAAAVDKLEEAALLLYLNRTCFNGLYRENSSGEFNVPIGRYANPDWVRDSQVRAASEVLNGTEIKCEDFEYVLDAADAGDLVYFDPPYEPVSQTADFNDYAADGFDREDQQRLLETARTLNDQGVYVILSNSGVMYDFYDDAGFHVEIEGAKRSINSDETSRGEVDEIIATNVPPEERQTVGQQSMAEYSD